MDYIITAGKQACTFDILSGADRVVVRLTPDGGATFTEMSMTVASAEEFLAEFTKALEAARR